MHCFDTVLRLPAPGDAVHHRDAVPPLPGNADATIVTAQWPAAAGRDNADAETDFTFVQSVISAVREVRSRFEVKPNQVVNIHLSGLSARAAKAVEQSHQTIRTLAKVKDFQTQKSGAGVTAVLQHGASVYVELGGATDLTKQCRLLRAEFDRLYGQLQSLKAKLDNPAS